MKNLYLLLIVFLPILGFTQKLGRLPIKNYTAKDYNGDTQVNDLAKNKLGILYIAHNSGVSFFDGVNWSQVQFKEDDPVQSIHINELDQIFIGKNGDFGYVEVSKKGEQIYVSLKHLIKKEIRFNKIWKIESFNGGIIFCSNESLFFYKNNEIIVISNPNRISTIYKVNESVFVNIDTNKLYKLESDLSLRSYQITFPNGETEKLFKMIPRDSNNALIVTKNTLYNLNLESKTASKLENSEEFEYNIYGNVLRDGKIILSTKSGGSVLFDKDMSKIEFFNTESGMLSDVHQSFEDTKDGNLIIGTKNGISIIHESNTLRLISKNFGLNGSVNDLFYSSDRLYTVGNMAAYEIDGLFDSIKEIDDPKKQAGYRGDDIDGLAYFSMDYGLYVLNRGNNKIEKLNNEFPWFVTKYKSNPNYVIQGDNTGLIIYYYDSLTKKLTEKLRHEGSVQAESFFEDENGVFWCGGYNSAGIYRYEPKFNPNNTANSGEFKYISPEEIGTMGDIKVFGLSGQVYFATANGVFTMINGKPVLAERFNRINQKSVMVNLSFPDNQGRVWLGTQDSLTKKFIVGYIDNNGNWTYQPFNWLNENPVYSIFSNKENEVWFGTPEGLYYGDLNKDNHSDSSITYIRTIKLGTELIHSGLYYYNNSFQTTQDSEYIFEHSNKSLEFYFGTNVFIPYDRIEYSYKLVGFNQDYSTWNFEDKATFTNLPKGTYKIIVKSRNKSGIEGKPIVVSFKILAPWYLTWWFITICAILFMFVLWGLYRLRTRALRQRQEELENTVEERTAEVVEQKKEVELQRDEAHRQKKTVEHKNREIMESITYAKRLQEAILPPPRLVKEWLTESFLYFKPKDIVAGDFYWMDTIETNIDGKKKTLIFFAAADCTGHGVPGAMVSVVCANAMNRAVKEFKLSDPGEVLDKVTELVIQSFDQSEEDIKDGMDIALCALDIRDKKLYYSGANNPVYIITEADPESKNKYKTLDEKFELVEIKATKQPVGKYDLVKAFETQVIDLNPGDAIYVFSDGFADQFGGLKGKKYKYATFKRYLLEISQLEMEAQKTKLHTEFETWRDGLEQVDDICIIGVRINGKERNNFTTRELEVLALLEQGLSSKLIADKMEITKNTVDTYRRRLLAKTSTYNATELINYCKEKDIL